MPGILTIEQMQSLADRYEARFGNLEEVLHFSFMTEPAFLNLLDAAAERGRPLTGEEIKAAIPEAVRDHPEW